MTQRESLPDVVAGIRRPVRLLPVVLLIVVRASAFASPPDPLWITGWYDGGDSDDMVLGGCFVALPIADSSLVPRPESLVGARLLVSEFPLVAAPPSSAPRPRAPPPGWRSHSDAS